MKTISKSRRAIREALADVGWRFSLVSTLKELEDHRHSCRTVVLPSGSESDCRVRSTREHLLSDLPWEYRRHLFPRWLSYLPKPTRLKLQPHLPVAAEFCLTHGFILLLGEVWGERDGRGWRVHRVDGPAVIIGDKEHYFWRGWHVSKDTVTATPTAERILKEDNQTHREVLLQRMGVENFMREAELKPVDTFRDSVLLKVDTAGTRGRWRDGQWATLPLQLAFIKVICPSTQKTYFLRVDPDVENAKQALQSTLPGYTRDWELDMVAET